MSIDDIRPSDVVAAYGQQNKNPKGTYNKQNFSERKRFRARFHHNIHDETTILNIPSSELTPAVNTAIALLMNEIDQLEDELFTTHMFEKRLEETIDHHMDLPVLTRHALLRETGLLAQQLHKSQSEGVFVYLHIENYFEFKQTKGIEAADIALKGLAEVVLQHIRKTDLIGTLGGDGFGILLTLTGLLGAQEKMDQICKVLRETPVVYPPYSMELKYAYGLALLDVNASSKEIMIAADTNLRAKGVMR